MPKILVLHGPDTNSSGQQETEPYGTDTLQAIDDRLVAHGKRAGVDVLTFRSRADADLVERVRAAKSDETAYIIINPAGYTHTSTALRDALAAAAIPFIEVHLPNVHAREPLPKHSSLSGLARGVISGLGPEGYELAMEAALRAVPGQ